MARPLRIDIPGGVYHVTSRGLERRAIVRDDEDRKKWVELLDRVASRRRWRVFAWALMRNHFHVFLEAPDADLSSGMHDLNSGYVSAFNRRYGRCGPLLQGRFKGIVVERAAHDWELSRYVHLNPVRAGLTEDPAAYGWSSCRHYFRAAGAPQWLAWEEVLSQHARTLRAARRAYREYLAEGVASPTESPLSGVVASSLLGSGGFVARMRARVEDHLADREIPAARELRAAVAIEQIEAAVCETFGVEPERLRARRRRGNEPRAVAIYLSRKVTGVSMAELGRRFGGVSGQAAGVTAREVAARVARGRHLARVVRRCEAAARSNFQLTT